MDYVKHYEKLIERARNRNLTGYKEKHHIVPKIVGGGNEKENIVALTPEEHYLAHLLLVKMHRYQDHPKYNRLIYAANMLTVGKARNNKAHGWVRRRLSIVRKQDFIGRKQTAEHISKRVAKIRGRKRTPESIEKIRVSKRGVKRAPFSVGQIEKMRKASLGRRHSDATKEKMRQSALVRPVPMTEARNRQIQSLAAINRGRKDTPETAKRRSEAAKAGWLKRKKKYGQQP